MPSQPNQEANVIRGFFSGTWRALGFLWRGLDASRRFLLNLILLVIVVAVVAGLFHQAPEPLRARTTLVLNLTGQVTEQHNDNDRASLLRAVQDDAQPNPLLRDVLAAIDHAATDPDITQMLLQLDGFRGAGLPTLREVAAALDRFKARGKPVVAWSSHYAQGPYYLAAHASQVYLHPQGDVSLVGFGAVRSYYKDALDKLGVTVKLIRVGTYKSAAEPFIANGPSPAATEAADALYGDLWSTYLAGVEAARKLPKGSISAYIDSLPERLAALDGDAARLALAARLVDGLKTDDELSASLLKTGAYDPEKKTYRAVSFEQYLQHLPMTLPGKTVGVIVAEGEIVDGRAHAGGIGGLSTAELVRKARQDDKIKAVVLRVNSPGGSAFASELIRHELALLRAAGKPVVVSMGDVAASGGYWISMASDAVYADAATVTGSIGVFSLLPTAEGALDKLGVHASGSGTTWLTHAGHPGLPVDPRFEAILQSQVKHIYGEFTHLAAQARKTDPAKIDAVAQGRVWTGQQAKARGLVDQLGNLGDAIQAAAKLAKLPGTPKVSYIEPEPGRLAALFDTLNQQTRTFLSEQFQLQVDALFPATRVVREMGRDMSAELGWLTELKQGDKPFVSVAHCFCTAP